MYIENNVMLCVFVVLGTDTTLYVYLHPNGILTDILVWYNVTRTYIHTYTLSIYLDIYCNSLLCMRCCELTDIYLCAIVSNCLMLLLLLLTVAAVECHGTLKEFVE